MKNIILGLTILVSNLSFASEDLTVKKVTFGTFIKHEKIFVDVYFRFENGESTMKQFSANDLTDSCLVGETSEYSKLPYNAESVDKIKEEVCYENRTLHLSHHCYKMKKKYLVPSKEMEAYVTFKTTPELIIVKLSNNEEININCKQ
jgi:hypothetical protein